jgi:hypothetical protein
MNEVYPIGEIKYKSSNQIKPLSAKPKLNKVLGEKSIKLKPTLCL